MRKLNLFLMSLVYWYKKYKYAYFDKHKPTRLESIKYAWWKVLYMRSTTRLEKKYAKTVKKGKEKGLVFGNQPIEHYDV